MTRIDTTRTHRPIDAGAPTHRKDRAAEAIILAAGIVLGGLMTSVEDAYGSELGGLRLAAAETTTMWQTTSAQQTGGLDLSLPDTSRTSTTTSAMAYHGDDSVPVTELDGQTRLHGMHRLEIDLYGDGMRPQADRTLR